ncbi:hypothetical protein ACQJBY_029433 [Aegilops geniculata]
MGPKDTSVRRISEKTQNTTHWPTNGRKQVKTRRVKWPSKAHPQPSSRQAGPTCHEPPHPLPRQIWAPHPREPLAAARAPPVLRARAQWRLHLCCSSPPSPSRSPSPSLAMGSAASTDRAERRRRDRAPGQSGAPDPLAAPPQDPSASASEADVSRNGCKVAPEPNDGEETAPLPGSPSFRIYCQKAAQVDALVAEADDENADGDHGDEFASATTDTTLAVRKNDPPQCSGDALLLADTTLAVRKNDPPQCSGELPKSKEGWLKVRGQTAVGALYSFIACHSKRNSAPPPPHPPAAKTPRSPGAAPPAAVAAEPYL